MATTAKLGAAWQKPATDHRGDKMRAATIAIPRCAIAGRQGICCFIKSELSHVSTARNDSAIPCGIASPGVSCGGPGPCGGPEQRTDQSSGHSLQFREPKGLC